MLSCSAVGLVLPAAVSAQSSTESYSYDVLGRLVEAETLGGQNNNENQSLCYDKAGNRTNFRAASDGSSSSCTAIGTPVPTPAPTPPPAPPPPPPGGTIATQNDYVSGICYFTLTVNVTANDTDSGGHYPLVLESVSRLSGGASATIVSASSLSIDFGLSAGTTYFEYTVRNSQNAVATGTVAAATVSCSGTQPL